MKLLNHIPAWLRNKYLISFAAFCVVVLFLDKNDFFTQLERRRELRELQQNKQFYTTRIATERKELEALKVNPATVEKYAREKYLMKRDNEDLFVISENPDPPGGQRISTLHNKANLTPVNMTDISNISATKDISYFWTI
ncbi:MAG: septum formation initiator family protein [Chitinophagaceae bacterium]|nr:septum formation initiator family protein [Chitinophagaceae bacterium]